MYVQPQLAVCSALVSGWSVECATRLCKRAVLCDRFLLNRREIIKKVRTWIIVVPVVPHEAANRKDSISAEQASPRRRDVEGSDLQPLIGRTQRVPQGVGLPKVENVIEAVWVLKP